ncbi:hypothetical protein D9M68_781470 [compost metagenome]
MLEHLLAEARTVATPWIDDQYLGTGCAVAGDKVREQARVVTLIQQIAADDQVEQAEAEVFLGPVATQVINRLHLVEHGIAQEELARQRVIVAGGDIGP